MPSKFPHFLDPMEHPASPKKITFSFDEKINGGDQQEMANATVKYISKALKDIDTTINVLKFNVGVATKYLQLFFYCEKDAVPAQKKEIMAKYALIRTGLM